MLFSLNMASRLKKARLENCDKRYILLPMDTLFTKAKRAFAPRFESIAI